MSKLSFPYFDFVVLMGNYTPMGASFPLPGVSENTKKFERYAAGIVAGFLGADAVTTLDDEMEEKLETLMDRLNHTFDCIEVGDAHISVRMGRNDVDSSVRYEVSVPGGLPGSLITMTPLDESCMFYRIISISVGGQTALIEDVSVIFDTVDFCKVKTDFQKSNDLIRRSLGSGVTMISCGEIDAFDVQGGSTMPPALLEFIQKLNRRSSRRSEPKLSKKLH